MKLRIILLDNIRHVASIATFLEFKDKGVVRDVARALNIPLPDVNKVLKTVDTWDEYCTSKIQHGSVKNIQRWSMYGEQLRGRIRGTGIHAAGVVTSKEPIFRYAPYGNIVHLLDLMSVFHVVGS
jgi:DNA polymerase-3 subunit alpha